MSLTLRPCPRCLRHVRLAEPSCPFCDESRVARAGLGVALAAGAALALTACDSASVASAQVDDEAVRLTPQYGAPSDPYPPPPPPPRDEPDAGKPR